MIQRARSSTRWIAALLVLLLLELPGCRTISQLVFPTRAALAEVHRVYRAEFAAAFLAGGPESRSCEVPGEADSFPETLRAIRAYRVEHPGARRELAHLSVLEGMIYLQSGRLGMAALVKDDVSSAADDLLSGAGSYARDGLFARNFDDLIAGWTAVCDSLSGKTGAAVPYQAPSAYLAPARGIQTDLEAVRDQLEDPEADEGAVYLATTAAIFYVWAHAANEEKCGLNDEASCDRTALDDQTYLKQAEAVLRPRLSDSEVKLAGRAGGSIASAPGRIRYVLWYREIEERITSQ